jgi:hypothetical protein
MTVKIQSEKMTHNTITLTNYKREITFHECANVALHVVIREASSSGPCVPGESRRVPEEVKVN